MIFTYIQTYNSRCKCLKTTEEKKSFSGGLAEHHTGARAAQKNIVDIKAASRYLTLFMLLLMCNEALHINHTADLNSVDK